MKFKGYRKLRQSVIHILMVSCMATEFGLGKLELFLCMLHLCLLLRIHFGN